MAAAAPARSRWRPTRSRRSARARRSACCSIWSAAATSGAATWAALAGRYDDRQLIEVPMLVGHYHMLAFTLNSLGIQVEEPGEE